MVPDGRECVSEWNDGWLWGRRLGEVQVRCGWWGSQTAACAAAAVVCVLVYSSIIRQNISVMECTTRSARNYIAIIVITGIIYVCTWLCMIPGTPVYTTRRYRPIIVLCLLYYSAVGEHWWSLDQSIHLASWMRSEIEAHCRAKKWRMHYDDSSNT